MGRSSESHQTTAPVWLGSRRCRFDREGHAWWNADAITLSGGGCEPRPGGLRLGSSHRDGAETSVRGLVESRVPQEPALMDDGLLSLPLRSLWQRCLRS